MLDLVDETLHQVPLPVQPCVVSVLVFASGMGRNDRFGSPRDDEVQEVGRVVATVGDHALEGDVWQQGFGLGNVMVLAGCQPEAQRVAQAINADMDFGTEAPATTSQRLRLLTTVFFSPPAAHG